MNKKLVIVLMALAALLMTVSSAWAEYNKDQVVNVMRTNAAKLGEIKTAVTKADYFAAASAFFEIAKGMHSIRSFNPNKGAQDHWETTMDAVITAALRGVGAAAEKDTAALNKYLAELQSYMKEGHSVHR